MNPTQQTRLALEMAFNKSAGMDKEADILTGVLAAAGRALPTATQAIGKWAPRAARVGAGVLEPLSGKGVSAATSSARAAAYAAEQAGKSAPAKGLFDSLVSKVKGATPLQTGIAAAGATGVAGLGYGELRNGQGQEEGAAKAIDGFQGGSFLQRIGAAFAPGQLTDAAGQGVGNRVRQMAANRPPPDALKNWLMGRQ